ncbi:DUF6287 domain-containing protein [Fructilactobacillus sp. Tb1]|uniref:DUF6287 domain-containing protein n=1 Tax=Fructilactobacillus sp. Tb1 TaxID=3422304 RepID=UPI003D29990A
MTKIHSKHGHKLLYSILIALILLIAALAGFYLASSKSNNLFDKVSTKRPSAKIAKKADSSDNEQDNTTTKKDNTVTSDDKDNATETDNKKTEDSTNANAGLNISQISNDDYSSLVGKWTNNAGKTMDVTNTVESEPNSKWTVNKGVIIADTERNGYPQVLTGGSRVTNGTLQGGIGSFDPSIMVSAFAPVVYAPKGQKINDSDDSDSNRDRIIIGGGQAGYASQAYYRN